MRNVDYNQIVNFRFICVQVIAIGRYKFDFVVLQAIMIPIFRFVNQFIFANYYLPYTNVVSSVNIVVNYSIEYATDSLEDNVHSIEQRPSP